MLKAISVLRTLRRFSSFNGRLQRLQQEADLVTADAHVQTRFYKALLEEAEAAGGDRHILQDLVSRVERQQYPLDSDGARVYVQALNRLGRGDVALQHVMRNFSQRQQQRSYEPPQYESRQNSQNPFVAGESVGTAQNPLHMITQPPEPTRWEKLLQLAKIGLAGYLLLSLYTLWTDELPKITGSSRAAPNYTEFDPSAERDENKITKFADVQGIDEAKDDLMEVVEFLKNPDKFTRLGGKLPKGILLVGQPGTGKTMLARAIACEANVPFIHTSGSEFDEMYVGVGSKRVRELFEAARKKGGPCLIFIDEIDAIGGKRNPKDQVWTRMTLNQLLVELDGFDQTAGIIVIGATNVPQALDKALTRPGRFDRNINIPLPDVAGRFKILEVHTRKVQLADDVKLNIIARQTPGFSGAELANLINYAAIRAATTGKRQVTHDDIEYSRDRILMGAEKKQSMVGADVRRLVAYHEAGHAVMALYTRGAQPIHKATIMARGDALGMVSQLPETDDPNWTRRQYKARLDVCMGGRCSEELIVGAEDVTSGASSDIAQATRVARAMVTQLGMGATTGMQNFASSEFDYSVLAPETRQQIDADVRQLLDESYKRACAMLLTRRKELDTLAHALLKYETLTKDEIERVIRGEQLTRPVLPADQQ